jgi:HAE1 family hydrophobic/amphiphilic exporter-1
MLLADVSIRRPVFTVILMAVLVLFGLVGLRALGLDLMPKIEAPFVTVSVVYPGADPDVVENRVLEVIEDACSTISGVKKITSSAVESYGLVFIEFELDVAADRAVQDVRDQIASVEDDLPSDARKPLIQKIDIGAAPVVALVLTGPAGTSAADLTHVADKRVRAGLQRIAGVGVVNILGKQEREIHIEADPDKLRAYGLTLPDVEQAVAYGNLDVPGGRLTLGGQELLLKTYGEATSLEDLRALVLANPAGFGPVRLRDVAEVRDTTEEARSLTALDGVRALTLYVLKQSDANSVAVADAVMRAVAEDRIALPQGYALKTIQTTSDFTRRSVNSVLEDLILGGALAVLIILLFLRDWRATFISALALPTSVVATFAFMRLFGFTLNNITLLALSLSIGMLIDDAIVVIENIHRHMKMGKPARQAASEATEEIGLAVMAITLSIVVVFVPVALMKGIVGRFFFEFGITVAAAVTISLFVSFTLTPMGASRLLRDHPPGRLSRILGRGLDALDRAYRATIGWVLDHRLAVIMLGVLALAGAGYLARFIPTEFQPSMDQGELDVTFNLPEGTSLDATYLRGEEIRAELARAEPSIQFMNVAIGAGMRQKVNEGKVFVKLPPARGRARSQDQVAVDLRRSLAARFPGQDISVSQAATGGSGMGNEMMSKPLNIQLRGTDSRLLRETAQRLIDELRRQPGFVDLSLTDRGARPQTGFQLDRDKVSAAGLAPAQVAMVVRTAIQGTEVSQYRVGADRYKVLVKAPEAYTRDRQRVLGIPLRGPAGNLVEIGELIRPVDEDAPAQIDREDRVRQVSILGNLEGLVLGEAQKRVDTLAANVLPPEGVELKFSGQGEIMEESFRYMLEALLLAIILIYMVLAAQFESFLHPITIMVSLPMSMIGALLALLLTGQTLSIMSFIGIIMLMGLVTKNAVLLVDNANQRRKREGLPVRQALIEAGAVRLRPILMTTLAMIFGMLPVALALGEGSEFRAPMAVAVIGGLITSTMLTLLVVPAVYSSFESARRLLAGQRQS